MGTIGAEEGAILEKAESNGEIALEMPTMVDMPTASATEVTGDTAECRICLMSDEVKNLCSPCKCQGSVQYVHTECLRLWCRERASLRCEICHNDYNVDALPEAARAQILDAVQAAQAEQAVERERQRQRHQQQYLPRLSDHFESLHDFESAIQRSEIEEVEERAAQVRRLVMFAALVTVTMLLFHLIGSLLLSHAAEASESHQESSLYTTSSHGDSVRNSKRNAVIAAMHT
jgi:hypothetical protein